MARPRQPIDLLVVKGKKHLTKDEIKNRRATEVKAPADKVRAPSYLSAELKREFNRLSKELLAIGIMTNLDIDALARFVIARKMYIDLTNRILENPEVIIIDKDILTSQDKLFRQCRSAAGDLGLTISSRCKLVVPKPQEEKPESKWSRFGAGGMGD